jgi:O-antigen ligase
LTAALIRTGSRGGVVALATMVVALMAFSDRRFRKRQIAFLVVGIVVMLAMPNSQIMDRFQELTSGGDYNFTARDGRLEIWRRGFGMMFNHPILGVGIRAYEMASGFATGSWMNAHNALIQVGAELGLFGLIAFVTAAIYSVRSGLRVRKACEGHTDDRAVQANQLAIASVTSLLSLLVAAQFLSMAFDAMTFFAVAAPSGLALALNPAVLSSTSKAAPQPGPVMRRSRRSLA